MQHITTHKAQLELERIIDSVTRYNEPVTIISDNQNATVLLSMEAWSSIQETIYLQSVAQMEQSLHAAAAEPIDEGIDALEVVRDS